MLKNEWASNADLVFANATCFSPEMVSTISKIICEKLKKGAVVIFTTKPLEFTLGQF